MNRTRWMMLAGLMSFGFLASPAQAQVAGTAAPRTFYGYGSNGYGYYYYPTAPRVLAPRTDYVRVNPVRAAVNSPYQRDWSTGRDNLPLSKPWMRPLR